MMNSATDLEKLGRKLIFDEFGLQGEVGEFFATAVTAVIGVVLATIQEDLTLEPDDASVTVELMVECLLPFARKHDTEHAEEWAEIDKKMTERNEGTEKEQHARN